MDPACSSNQRSSRTAVERPQAAISGQKLSRFRESQHTDGRAPSTPVGYCDRISAPIKFTRHRLVLFAARRDGGRDRRPSAANGAEKSTWKVREATVSGCAARQRSAGRRSGAVPRLAGPCKPYLTERSAQSFFNLRTRVSRQEWTTMAGAM